MRMYKGFLCVVEWKHIIFESMLHCDFWLSFSSIVFPYNDVAFSGGEMRMDCRCHCHGRISFRI